MKRVVIIGMGIGALWVGAAFALDFNLDSSRQVIRLDAGGADID